MENKSLFIGALGAFFLATTATLVSDMHGIGDWFISFLQSRKYPLNPAPIYGTPYTIAGYFDEPLLILSIAMLLVGGGIFPPILGIIIGAVATRINAPLTWWDAHLSVGFRNFLKKLWSGWSWLRVREETGLVMVSGLSGELGHTKRTG